MAEHAQELLPKKNRVKAMLEDAISGRRQWAELQREIIQRKKGARSRTKRKPYRRAPNFVVPIIDDVVREKTDQEITMLWNAPLLAHIQPLEDMPVDLRQKIARGFDSYVRYIIKARSKIESAFNIRNARGMGCFKALRRFNPILQQDAPDLDVLDPFDVIVPTDARIDHEPEWIAHVLRLTPRQLRERSRERGWRNVEQVIKEAKKDDRLDMDATQNRTDDYIASVANLIGITTSGNQEQSPFIVIWEIYRYAFNDEREGAIQPGRKLREIMCPDCPNIKIHKVAWRDALSVVMKTDEEFAADAATAAERGEAPQRYTVQPGRDRPWPIVQTPFEYESLYWYDTRGAGHLVLDDQLEATASKNTKAVVMEYTQNPLFTGKRPKNAGNIGLQPGEFLPTGTQRIDPPQVNPQYDFDINNARATAARRVGAAGQFNFSTDIGRRNVEKTATEVQTESSRVGLISSASVERMNEPLAHVFQMLWDDMRRMRLVFPIVLHSGSAEQFDQRAYDKRILLMPAASSKTLNPDIQMNRAISIISGLLSPLRQAGIPVRLQDAARTALAMYDPRLTADWIPSDQEQMPTDMQVQQNTENIQAIAQASQQMRDQLQQVVEQIGNLAVENSDNIRELQGQGQDQGEAGGAA